MHNAQTFVTVNNQKFSVSYPNVGKQFDIENTKLLLTNGGYGDLARSGHLRANKLLDFVDAFSTLLHLLPQLSLDASKFFDMDDVTAMGLVLVYKEQVLPFLKQCEEEIAKFLAEVNKPTNDSKPKQHTEAAAQTDYEG